MNNAREYVVVRKRDREGLYTKLISVKHIDCRGTFIKFKGEKKNEKRRGRQATK